MADADRIGAVDEHGNVVDAHKIFAVILQWLLKRKQWPRRCGHARSIRRRCSIALLPKHGRKLIEHGIGFKYVVDLMLERARS